MLLFGVQGQKKAFLVSVLRTALQKTTLKSDLLMLTPIKSLHEALQRIKATAVEKLKN